MPLEWGLIAVCDPLLANGSWLDFSVLREAGATGRPRIGRLTALPRALRTHLISAAIVVNTRLQAEILMVATTVLETGHGQAVFRFNLYAL
ncbi:MAG: hypothetical protein ACK53L_14980 [Pirellulaceae bacterium]